MTQTTDASVTFSPAQAVRKLPDGDIDDLGFFSTRQPRVPASDIDDLAASLSADSLVLSASALDPRAWSSLIAARWGGADRIEVRQAPVGKHTSDAEALSSLPEVRLLDNAKNDTESSGAVVSDDWRKLSRLIARIRPEVSELYPSHLANRIDHLDEIIDGDLIETLFSIVYASANAGDEHLERRDFLHGAESHAVLRRVFYARLGWFDDILSRHTFILGDRFTDADAHLFGVLLTFDIGYRNAFPVPDAAIVDYPHLWDYAKRIFAIDGLVTTANRQSIGLLQQEDGTYATPWGRPAFTETVDDIRAAWNE